MAWPSKHPDDYAVDRPLAHRWPWPHASGPDERAAPYRNWKWAVTPFRVVLAFAAFWLLVSYLAFWASGIDPFGLEFWVFLWLPATWLAHFDGARFAGAAARAGRSFPSPRTAAFGSAPWGLLVAAQLAVVAAGVAASAAIGGPDQTQLLGVFGGLVLAFVPSWLLEWWLGGPDRAAAAADRARGGAPMGADA